MVRSRGVIPSTHETVLIHLMKKLNPVLLKNWKDDYGSTMAHQWFYGIDREMYELFSIMYLIEVCGLDPKVTTNDGQSLLELAIFNDDQHSVYYLLEKWCNPNVFVILDHGKGRDPLMHQVFQFTQTCSHEKMEKIQKYHDTSVYYPNTNHEVNSHILNCPGCSQECSNLPPLTNLVIFDLYKIIKECIRHGYNYKRTDDTGKTLKNYIEDMITVGRHEDSRLIDWYNNFIAEFEESN